MASAAAAAGGPPDGEYKIRNRKYSKCPLFCGDGTDKNDDHWAWVEMNPGYENKGKERWQIRRQSDGWYKIFSVRYGGPLFCGDGKDGGGDHWAWIEPRPSYENGGKERWRFEKQSDGYWKIFNKKWKGPLFCGDSKDGGGDHWAWVEERVSYEKDGKERWTLENMSTSGPVPVHVKPILKTLFSTNGDVKAKFKAKFSVSEGYSSEKSIGGELHSKISAEASVQGLIYAGKVSAEVSTMIKGNLSITNTSHKSQEIEIEIDASKPCYCYQMMFEIEHGSDFMSAAGGSWMMSSTPM